MPEDQVIEEEISEQVEADDDAETGFDEFADEPDGEEKDVGDKEDDEDENPDDEKPGEKDESEKEDDNDDELPAKAAIDERLKEIEKSDDKKDEKQDKSDSTPAEPGEKVRPSSTDSPPARLTKEQIAQHLAVISDDELPDGEILIGDDKFNFKELKEDDPEVYNAMKVMSSIAGVKYLNAAIQSGKLVTADAVKELKDEVSQVRDLLSFSTEMINKGHGDFLGIIHSKDYQKWIEEQSEGVKTLASSSEIDDSVRVLSFYKESIAKTKTGKHDEKLDKKHSRKRDLLRGKRITKPVGPEAKEGAHDDETAFNEYAE